MPIYVNQSSFTSPAHDLFDQRLKDVYLTITGPGPVALEQLGEDGVWRSFPSTRFSGDGAHVITCKRGQIRVVITGGPTTVGLSL
jgi:hypothetical protein